ncbi:hypothetical protein IQ07DRAFT_589872 [Pyrenochaeta sp. DS3sAY3a]|nr:hypothetical protein IQ07DRAFT_589872 [Pyrenochaeta sp. DS3sAY3a]
MSSEIPKDTESTAEATQPLSRLFHTQLSFKPETSEITDTSRKYQKSLFLQLPAEIRLQIYEYVLGSYVVHVRMSWSGVSIPSGFSYSCLENTRPLLERNEKALLARSIPFGSDVTVLTQVCYQTYKETALLPFKWYIWAFETAFTLDQFFALRRKVPVAYKSAIWTVAVPMPGPYRSTERLMHGLQTVLLIGSFQPGSAEDASDQEAQNPSRGIMTIRKDNAGNSWVRCDEKAEFARSLFVV